MGRLPEGAGARAKWAARLLFRFMASYGLACVLLSFLLVLTFFGTLEQVDVGIYQAQKKYFESIFLVEYLFDRVPVPLPGGYILMTLLFFNLLCGGLIRARKDWRRPGMLIAHSGILLLLLSGFVTYSFSRSGHMTLFEGEQSNQVVSYFDWEVAVRPANAEPGEDVEYLIPGERFRELDTGQRRRFEHPEWPFALELSGFLPNARPEPAGDDPAAVEGVRLAPLPWQPEAEQNVAGVYAAAVSKDSSASGEAGEAGIASAAASDDATLPERGVLWGLDVATWQPVGAPGQFRQIPPWSVAVEDEAWVVELRRARFNVPFTIKLEDFIHELHPGTTMASNFESRVTKIEEQEARDIAIKMNEPLRHEGYTFFQASWGPQDAGPNTPLFSVFAVVDNPADQWPKYACYVIGVGLLIHFVQKLAKHLKRENRRRAT